MDNGDDLVNVFEDEDGDNNLLKNIGNISLAHDFDENNLMTQLQQHHWQNELKKLSPDSKFINEDMMDPIEEDQGDKNSFDNEKYFSGDQVLQSFSDRSG